MHGNGFKARFAKGLAIRSGGAGSWLKELAVSCWELQLLLGTAVIIGSLFLGTLFIGALLLASSKLFRLIGNCSWPVYLSPKMGSCASCGVLFPKAERRQTVGG